MLIKGNQKGFTLLELVVVISVMGVMTALATLKFLKNSEKLEARKIGREYSTLIASISNRVSISSRYKSEELAYVMEGNLWKVRKRIDKGSYSESLGWLKYDNCFSGSPITDAISHSLSPKTATDNVLTVEQDNLVLSCGEQTLGYKLISNSSEIVIKKQNKEDSVSTIEVSVGISNIPILSNSRANLNFNYLINSMLDGLRDRRLVNNDSKFQLFYEGQNKGSVEVNYKNPGEINELIEAAINGSVIKFLVNNVHTKEPLLSDGSIDVNKNKSLCWEMESNVKNCITSTNGVIKFTDEKNNTLADIEAKNVITNDNDGSRYTVPKIQLIRAGTNKVRKIFCPKNFSPKIAVSISSFGDNGGDDFNNENDWGNTTDGGGVHYETSSPASIVATGWDSGDDPNFWNVNSLLVSTNKKDGMKNSNTVNLVAFTWCEEVI